jgi:heat-inducible transcriptional repressor
MPQLQVELTPRQREILFHVVDEYVGTGQPVGSKMLVQSAGLEVSSSTVRTVFSELERLGLLTHPHTSAGRIPTESGYRLYVERVIERLDTRPEPLPLDLSGLRSEVEVALETTTELLANITHLIALVSAPSIDTANVRHVEVLLLQPRLVMVVVITSSGGVAKRVFTFDSPVDEGLAAWAGEYLNEALRSISLGSHQLRRRFEDPSLGASERRFLDALRPAFAGLEGAEERRVYIGGAAGLLEEVRADELDSYRRLLEILEKRAALLDLMARALDPRRPFVRFGEELEETGLGAISIVGAAYGLPTRALGTVSLVGPQRMDYGKAIRTVRSAAWELSRFVETVYEDE